MLKPKIQTIPPNHGSFMAQIHFMAHYHYFQESHPPSIKQLVGGIPIPLKNDGVKVSLDDEIPNWMESHKTGSSHHQPE